MKTGIKYDLMTNEILGIVQVSVDSDLESNKGDSEGMIEVANDHAVVGDQKGWHIKALGPAGISLRRKPKIIRDKEKEDEKKKAAQEAAKMQARRDAPTNYLLEQLNELRAELGKPPIERADMQKRVKELEKQYGQ